MNYRKNTVKHTNTWRLNNTLLNNQDITEEIKNEIKKYLETNDNENTMTQGFPAGTLVKNPPANEGDMGSSPGPGRSHMLRSN